MNNETKPHPMINELFKSEQNSSSINDTSLSLILSLRVNNQFLLQNQTIDEQNLVKFATLKNPFLSEILSDKTPHLLSNDNHSITVSTNDRIPLDERISNPTSTIVETSSIPTLLTNDRVSQWFVTQISDESSTVPNSTIDEMDTNVPSVTDMNDSIPISAKQLEKIKRKNERCKLQREIINIAKKTIKPAYKKRYITKDDYKRIMKKVVTKATYSNQLDQKWFNKTINSYVKKCRIV